MEAIIKPPALRKGDTVAIVAPASNLKIDYLARGVAELERMGFRVQFDEGILDRDLYTAGSHQRRATELIGAFADPEVKAVWAARGGYGSMRLLDLLDDRLLGHHPKVFIGYSDVTALHLYFYKRFRWVTFHGPMAAKDLAGGNGGNGGNGGETHYDRASLLAAISSAEAPREIDCGRTEMLHRGGGDEVSGRLLGGCLSIVAALTGTPYELDTRGSILFLEDTATKPFVIDRMLAQLRLAGKFDEVRAIIFGEMIDCVQHAAQGYRIQDVLAECTQDLGVPVMFGLPSGHSPLGNLTLPLGVAATLERGVLRIDEAAVV